MTTSKIKDTGDIVKPNSMKAWVLAARPKTLTGAAVPVMIGGAWAFVDSLGYIDATFQLLPFALCLLFAFVMQIEANFVNDFFDFLKGTDDIDTRLGPRRACAQGWVTLDAMKRAIALTMCVAGCVGLPLVWYGGMEMLLIGFLCVIFCFLYTTRLSYLGLGDVLVLVFFGIVPVSVTYYIQLHTCTWMVLLSSVACGLVIDTLLLVNNFRDRDNDRQAGKMTLVVKIGDNASLAAYLYSGVAAFFAGVLFLADGHIMAFVLPLLYLVLHLQTYFKIKRINRGKALNLCLGETARNMFVYGVTVSLGIIM